MESTVQYKGNDKLLFGIILGVLTFWLFAQTTLNINVVMSNDLGMDTSLMNIAVSITALFSGIFTVVLGGLADKVGRMKMIRIGFYFSIIGSLLVGLTPPGTFAGPVLIAGRIFQGLAGAAIMPTSLALVKAYWSGAERQRAISLWSMGSWGGSGFAALFGGLMVNLGWRYIFFAAVIVAIIGLQMIKGTPESKVANSENKKTDFLGIATFMIALIALELFVSKFNDYGITSTFSIAMILITIIFSIIFIKVESGKDGAFIDSLPVPLFPILC